MIILLNYFSREGFTKIRLWFIGTMTESFIYDSHKHRCQAEAVFENKPNRYVDLNWAIYLNNVNYMIKIHNSNTKLHRNLVKQN